MNGRWIAFSSIIFIHELRWPFRIFKLIHEYICIDLLKSDSPIWQLAWEDKVPYCFTGGVPEGSLQSRLHTRWKWHVMWGIWIFREALGDTHVCTPQSHTSIFQKFLHPKEKVQLDWVPYYTSFIIQHLDVSHIFF